MQINKYRKIIKNANPVVSRWVKLSFDISDKILTVMDDRGLTEKQVADTLNICLDVFHIWLTGTYDFTLKDIALIETKLNITIINL